jgi:hypothetical protein
MISRFSTDSLLVVPPPSSSTAEQPIPLTSINHVSRYLPSLQASKEKLTAEMEAMVFEGLSGLVSPPHNAKKGSFSRVVPSLLPEPNYPRLLPSNRFQPRPLAITGPLATFGSHRRR